MSKIPFTVYDFFAYLSSGGLVVAALDVVFGKQWVLRDKLSLAQGLVLLLVAYIVGHLVAHFSSFFLEHLLVAKVLHQPSSILLGGKTSSRLKYLFPGYYRALPRDTQERVKERAGARSAPTSGEALFLHAYAVVTKDSRGQERLDEFRNVYGFARNMTLALLLTALVLGLGTKVKHTPEGYGWAVLSAALGLGMLYRYLKFFRQFAYQLFIKYGELETSQEVHRR